MLSVGRAGRLWAVHTVRMTEVDSAPRSGLSARDVGVTFRRGDQIVPALSQCNIDVPEQNWFSLIGPSGCGKSTLLRLFADIVKPTTGYVTLGGKSPAQARAERSIALVSQQSVLLPWRKVAANVELGLEVAGVEKLERQRRAQLALELVGLRGFESAYPSRTFGWDAAASNHRPCNYAATKVLVDG